MKLTEKIRKWFEPRTADLSGCVSKLPAPTKYGELSQVQVTLNIRLYRENGNEQVRISMNNLGAMNVCLASFLTKGVSYAQEKFNEYQSKGEEPEADANEKNKSFKDGLARIEELRKYTTSGIKKIK